jgi:methionine-rich copper-binding protein CopC
MKRLVVAVVSLLLLMTPVFGHSSVVRSEPTNGETLKVPPREIRIWFSEPIKVGLSTFAVCNAAGKQIDQRDLRADEKEPALLRLTLPAVLTPGVYKVKWTAVAEDLHVTKGEFSFRIAP